MSKPNYSNVQSRVKNAKEGKSADFIPMIPEGQDSAVHKLRFVSGEVGLSKKDNIQAVIKCKVVARGKPENNKEENLYFLLDHPTVTWQVDWLLAVMDSLGLDFKTMLPENMEHEGWNDIFDMMDDCGSNIDFEVTYSYQYDKEKKERKKGYEKRINYDTIKAIEWPLPEGAKKEDAPADDANDDDDTP